MDTIFRKTILFRIWIDLVKTGIVKHTRNIGNAKLYRINIENKVVKKLVEMELI